MEIINRDSYMKKLISKKENGLIKVITGLRRVGKSFLLDPIFKEYLLESGVDEDHIIKLELDKKKNAKYRNADAIDEYIRSKVTDSKMHYILLDEIQLVDGFEEVLNGFLYEKNMDVYVTGSNSKFLSTDIITEFRGRSDEVKVFPLSFKEFSSVKKEENISSILNEYLTYGGMPLVLNYKTHDEKQNYLNTLFNNTYINDIVERYKIQRIDALEKVVDILGTSIGSLTNPTNLVNMFSSNQDKEIDNKTLESYLKYLEESFLISKVERYDIRGKKIITTPSKYYFTDIGIRNAKLNFRNQDQNHIIENIIYNELVRRGFSVDVGVVEKFDKDKNNKTIRKTYEIDFVCNMGFNRYYIQVAFDINEETKKKQETLPLISIYDNFKKIIIVKDLLTSYKTEEGITVIGLSEFLLNEKSIEL